MCSPSPARLLALMLALCSVTTPALGGPRGLVQGAAAQGDAPSELPVRFFMKLQPIEGMSAQVRTVLLDRQRYFTEKYSDLYTVCAYAPILGGTDSSYDYRYWFGRWKNLDDYERSMDVFATDSSISIPEWDATFRVESTYRMVLLPLAGRARADSVFSRYYWLRRGRALDGQLAASLKVARAITSHLMERHSLAVQLYVEEFGTTGQIHWHASFGRIETWGSLQKRLLADQEYLELLDEFVSLSAEGSFEDLLLERVD